METCLLQGYSMKWYKPQLFYYFCVHSWHACTLSPTQTHTCAHRGTYRAIHTQTSGCQVWHTSLNTSCHHLSCCPSLFYAVPHTLSLFVFFSYTPTHIPCICCFLSPLRVWGRIRHSFSVLFVDIAIILVVNVTPTQIRQQGLACCQLKKFLQTDFQLPLLHPKIQ